MAVTITYDARQNTNKNLGAAMSRGKKSISMEINFSGLSASTGGVTMTCVGFSTIDQVTFEQKSGYQIYYDDANTLIKIPQLADGVDLGSWTAVKAWAWGN
jgi:hypothetical protein